MREIVCNILENIMDASKHQKSVARENFNEIVFNVRVELVIGAALFMNNYAYVGDMRLIYNDAAGG